MPLERVTFLCFAASYTVALALELLLLFRTRLWLRVLAAMAAAAGLLAQTLFLAGQHVSLDSTAGALLFTAWVLAVFYLIGSIHHRRVAWGVFVLPVVLVLALLARLMAASPSGWASAGAAPAADPRELRILHIVFFLLAAVGVSIGFIASVMYLVQAQRLKAKAVPGRGLRLLSLERLETMNRRALAWAFPLLTVGLFLGIAQMFQEGTRLQGLADPRVISTCILWAVFAIVLYLRYGFHLRGRRVALLTILAFGLLLVTLIRPHQLPGGPP
jgi:ABC-type transport system involved in cytochrome c biogenesis permease subunit